MESQSNSEDEAAEMNGQQLSSPIVGDKNVIFVNSDVSINNYTGAEYGHSYITTSRVEAVEGTQDTKSEKRDVGNEAAVVVDSQEASSAQSLTRPTLTYSAGGSYISRWTEKIDLVTNPGAKVFAVQYGQTLHYSKESKIASGSDGTHVYVGMFGGNPVAVKKCVSENISDKDKDVAESLVGKRRPHVLFPDKIITDDHFTYHVSQLCEWNLQEVIEEASNPLRSTLNSQERQRMCVDFLKGLGELHRLRILHRDLKPSNVLLDQKGTVFVADFGISRILIDKTSTVTGGVGSMCWMAKEVLKSPGKNVRYTMSSDVQVAGCLLYYILTDGHIPHESRFPYTEDVPAVIENIRKDKYSLEHLEEHDSYRNLLESMIHGVAELRPDVSECLTQFQKLPPSSGEDEVDSGSKYSHSGQREVPPDSDVHTNSSTSVQLSQSSDATTVHVRTPSASSGVDMSSRGVQDRTDTSRSKKFSENLREYQRTLAAPALKKLNTVLVSPTGTGKTHVAAYIIDQHLQDLEEEGRRGKVAFIVPGVRLAHQQRDTLKELLGSPNRDIRCVVGQDIDVDCSLLSVMRGENVCITVMTAQVLLNGLLDRGSDKRVSWHDITLLVVDECHKTQKEHAYNKIMKQYLRVKKGREGDDKSVPQIVGMTAGVGTGGKDTTEDAMNHIYQVCANLDATVIQPVSHDQDLIKYLNVPKDIGPIILDPRKRDAFRVELEGIMYKIERKITAIEGANKGEQMNVSDVVRQCPRDFPSYEHWIGEFRNKCLENRDSYEDTLYQALIANIDNLKVYHEALCIHRDVRPQNAVDHLDAEIVELEFKGGQANEELIKLFKDSRSHLVTAIAATDETPLLKWMKEKLVDTFRKKPESGVLLFTRKRDYTKALLEWLLKEEAFRPLSLNPERITGVHDPNMKKSEGDTILANFRLRKHKIIVATNVLEEGIDLPACNLVLRHNYVPSETGHVQVKGRGRAKDSESFLVALSETGRNFKQQELGNQVREQLAQDILQVISSTSPLVVHHKIQQLQTENWRRIWLEDQDENLNAGVQDTSEWRLLCQKCPRDVCSSSEVVRFRRDKYVVTSSDFKDKCEITKREQPIVIKSNECMIAKIYCGNCRHDWGALYKYKSKKLPVIKIDRFSIKKVSTQEVTQCRKWKNVPFKVKDVDGIEMLPDTDLFVFGDE